MQIPFPTINGGTTTTSLTLSERQRLPTTSIRVKRSDRTPATTRSTRGSTIHKIRWLIINFTMHPQMVLHRLRSHPLWTEASANATKHRHIYKVSVCATTTPHNRRMLSTVRHLTKSFRPVRSDGVKYKLKNLM